MEINVLEESKNRILFELKGSDHGFCNMFVKELWKESSVKAAAYRVDHPLVGVPKLIVEVTQGNDVKKVIQKVLKSMKSNAEKFLKEVAKLKK
ncbi:RpoL/Rpb11 RNA polymerase subunit family protein [Nanoarchaeota archaeon]